MKKYLLFLITIVSLSLAGCSTDDDNRDCYEGFMPTRDLYKNGIDPRDLKVKDFGNDVGVFTVITSRSEFLSRVTDARLFVDQINFNKENILIGQEYIKKGSNVKINTITEQTCYPRARVNVTVDFINSSINNRPHFITYNVILPKLNISQSQYSVYSNFIY
ncbi:hypothetical protein [Myroides sp. N17-2]|uniref:hypothetical protein n=1 Tax=Myroides sp. N17-2 TaxID=2030799 RepID=UPI000EFA9EE8|nr:hypothetical protein [Myroides sp. N17-2]